jgi:hypothetical protein
MELARKEQADRYYEYAPTELHLKDHEIEALAI